MYEMLSVNCSLALGRWSDYNGAFFTPFCYTTSSRHLEIFELVRIEDEREFSARLEAVSHPHNKQLNNSRDLIMFSRCCCQCL